MMWSLFERSVDLISRSSCGDLKLVHDEVILAAVFNLTMRFSHVEMRKRDGSV